jgi:hypothetical protein
MLGLHRQCEAQLVQVLVNVLLHAALRNSPADDCAQLLKALPHSRLDAEIGRIIVTCGRHVQSFVPEQFFEHCIATTASCKGTPVKNCCKVCHLATRRSSLPGISARIGVRRA